MTRCSSDVAVLGVAAQGVPGHGLERAAGAIDGSDPRPLARRVGEDEDLELVGLLYEPAP
jgi:hypothetical protein